MEKKDKKEKQEETYEVKDKRAVNADEPVKEEQDAAAEGDTQETTPEEEQMPQFDLESMMQMVFAGMDVFDYMRFSISILGQRAWENMGLRLAPGQKELSKDLLKAKAAIDTIAFFADKLHPGSDENERRALRSIVSDLQINYVKHSE